MSSNNSLLSIDSKVIKYGLERTFQLLDACDNPHLATECMQIVGTNGKGSVSAMLSNALIKNKYDVGLYTSPHLVDLNERIRFNHKKISNAYIDSFTKKFKSEIAAIQPSFFEIMTVMALEYFKQKKANIAIMETGLGGRLDSVTAAKAKILIFTPIDIDHIGLLGNTIEEIAHEKSCAIQGSTKYIFSSNQKQEVKTILDRRAKKFKIDIKYLSEKRNFKLNSRHQVANARLAYQVLNFLRDKDFFKVKKIKTNLEQTKWPGRIQYISNSPDVIFDVAHNHHSILAFIDYFKTKVSLYENCKIIVGFESGKEINKTINQLFLLFNTVTITETKIRKSMKVNDIKHICSRNDLIIETNPRKALSDNLKDLKPNDACIILGSHYFGPYINEIFKNCFDIK